MSAKHLLALGALCALGAVSTAANAAATIVIVNNNAAGVGFNDPTPVAPVGGNAGTTLGQQRLNAFQYAASIWGATLTSSVTINIRAQFTPLTCTATTAVLGSAGPTEIFRDFTGAPVAETWFHAALADKLFGADLDPTTAPINANFNSNLGNAGCLTGLPFYLGLDNNHGPLIDLVTVLLHEFGHGLGFSTVTNAQTGNYLAGFPSRYDDFLLDTTQNLLWINMTPAQRAASSINTNRLVWTGAGVTAAVPGVLAVGNPQMTGVSPAAVVGTYLVGTASFGAPLGSPGLTAEVMPVTDSAAAGNACLPLSALNAAAVNGKFALVDRGVCGFTVKAANVQAAGAVGIIVADNVAGSPPPGLGGTDPTVTIPAVRITLADGNKFKDALKTRSRVHSGVFVTLGVDLNSRAGADGNNHVLVYTPNPFQPGSSVSHWDVSAFPNLLMEPAINGDLTHNLIPPNDLTFIMLKDLGW